MEVKEYVRKTFAIDLENWQAIMKLGQPGDGRTGRGRGGRHSAALRQIIAEWREMKEKQVQTP